MPLVYVGHKNYQFNGEGSLCDIAPTLLMLLGIRIPAEMTGSVLLHSTDTDPLANKQT